MDIRFVSQSRLARYGFGAALSAGAFAIERIFPEFFEPVIFFLFYPTGFLTAWIAGMGPAMLHLLLAMAGVYWIFIGKGALLLPEEAMLFRMCLFAAINIVSSWLLARGRRAEFRLRESEERLRIFSALVENSSDFIGIADPAGNPVYVNPAGLRMVGLDPGEPVERTHVLDYYAPGQRGFASEVILKTMLEEGRWNGETLFRHWGTEEAIPVSDEHFMIRDSGNGRVLGMGTITRDISERMRLEKALRRSEADLRRAQEVAGVGSWRLDIARNELSWSEETYRIFGLAPGTPLTYESFLNLVHPDDRVLVETRWTAALRGEPYDIEHRTVAGGMTRWVREKAEIERDENGRPLAGIGIAQDVTELRRAQTELGELRGRERFRAAIEAAANATLIVARQGTIAYLNEQAERLTGWRRDDLAGRHMELLIPERLRALHRAHHEGFFKEAVAKRPMGAGRELWLLRKGGEELPVEIGLARLEEAGEQIVVVTIMDITQRRTAEAAQRASEERLRLLVHETVDYAIFMHDLEGKVTLWNEGAQRILGYRAEEILSQDYRRLFTPEDIAAGKPDEEIRLAIAKGSLETEAWRVRRDGSRFRANVVVSPIRDAQGRLLGIGKVIRDLTEREKAEHELRESEARLKQSVVELEAFAYTISHDLRSPIRAIEGYSHFLARKLAPQLDSESRRMLERTRNAAVRLDHLIRDLLSYAAIRRDKVKLEAVDLDDILAHVREHYLELEKARLRVRSPLGRARAQRSLMLQVLANLLTNAVKFIPSERVPEIEVWTEREAGRVRLTVQDNGISIPREAYERVFEPFVRLNLSGSIEGTGIGLAIVKRAVESMGGMVRVESEPGRGSRFWIELQEA